MNSHSSFTFDLDIEGTHYLGTIIPSREIERNGFPVYFRIMIGGNFLANVSLCKTGWVRNDLPGKRDNKLIQRIGEYIQSKLT
jgi:hypothetical protein